MEDFKKYEMYINQTKKGIIRINWPLIKKAIEYSLAGIITVTTLTGCQTTPVEKGEPEVVEIDIEQLDDEIFKKQYFVDSVLEELYNSNNDSLVNKIMKEYEYIKDIEQKLDPTNEYVDFLTEEETLEKKQSMLSYLNNAVNIIEDNSEYTYGEDFVSYIRLK